MEEEGGARMKIYDPKRRNKVNDRVASPLNIRIYI